MRRSNGMASRGRCAPLIARRQKPHGTSLSPHSSDRLRLYHFQTAVHVISLDMRYPAVLTGIARVMHLVVYTACDASDCVFDRVCVAWHGPPSPSTAVLRTLSIRKQVPVVKGWIDPCRYRMTSSRPCFYLLTYMCPSPIVLIDIRSLWSAQSKDAIAKCGAKSS